MESGVISVQLWTVLGGLFLFGLAYNAAVAWMESRGYDQGFTAILVIFGVATTLIGVAVLDERAAMLSLYAFVASGTPMVIGSWWRYVRRRQAALQTLRGERRDETEAMAQYGQGGARPGRLRSTGSGPQVTNRD